MFTLDEIKKMPVDERKEVLLLHAGLQKKKATVVEKVERIPKNGYNSFHKYEYSTESDIKEGIRSLLSESGLTLDIELVEDAKTEVNTKQGRAWLHTVTMEFVLTDNDTGYMNIKRSKGEATDNGDKGIYKAYAGCIKYYLMNNFLISTGEKDNDPEAGDSEQIPKGNRGNNRNNKGGNNNRSYNNKGGNNGSSNQQRQQQEEPHKKPQQKPKATLSGIEAKWKQLNCGTLDGLDGYIEKKQKDGKDLEWIDAVLLGKIQAKQAEERKAKQEEADKAKAETNSNPESFDKDIQELKEDDQQQNISVTDVETGKTTVYKGKEILFE